MNAKYSQNQNYYHLKSVNVKIILQFFRKIIKTTISMIVSCCDYPQRKLGFSTWKALREDGFSGV